MGSKFAIQRDKKSFLKLKAIIEDYKGKKISATEFNSLKQADRLTCLKIVSGKLLKFDKFGCNISCLSKEHEDVHPSMGYCSEKGAFHCFSCDATFDIFDLLGAAYGYFDFKSQYAYAVRTFVESGADTTYRYEKRGGTYNKKTYENMFHPKLYYSAINNPHYKSLSEIPDSRDKVAAIEYLENKRCVATDLVSDEQIRWWEYKGENYIVFINDDGSVCRRWFESDRTKADASYAKEHPKYWNSKGIPMGVFNERVINDHDIVFVCEGAIDALTVMRMTRFASNTLPAISVNGVNNLSRLLETRPDMKAILLFDNDDAGRQAVAKWCDKFYVPDYLHAGYVGNSVISKNKDVNELFCSGKYIEEAKKELMRYYKEAKEFYERR